MFSFDSLVAEPVSNTSFDVLHNSFPGGKCQQRNYVKENISFLNNQIDFLLEKFYHMS